MNTKLQYNTLVILIGIISNLTLVSIVVILNIPYLFMDSIGTILTAVILGPIYGAIVGMFTNLITSLIIDYINLHFAIVNVLIGVIAGIIARKYYIKNFFNALFIGIIIGLVSGIISIPISIALGNEVPNIAMKEYIQNLINSGKSLELSTSITVLYDAIFDKVISCLMVFFIVNKIYFFKIYK